MLLLDFINILLLLCIQVTVGSQSTTTTTVESTAVQSRRSSDLPSSPTADLTQIPSSTTETPTISTEFPTLYLSKTPTIDPTASTTETPIVELTVKP